MTSSPPESDIDLFCDDVLRDPYPAYRELRDLGIKHLEVAARRA